MLTNEVSDGRIEVEVDTFTNKEGIGMDISKMFKVLSKKMFKVLSKNDKLSDDTIAILQRTLDVVWALRLLANRLGWDKKEVLDLLTILSSSAHNVEVKDGTFNFDEIYSLMELLDDNGAFKRVLDNTAESDKSISLMEMLYTKMYYELCAIEDLEGILASLFPEVMEQLDKLVETFQEVQPLTQSEQDKMYNKLATIYNLALMLEEAKK
jgi:hypothetical protein